MNFEHNKSLSQIPDSPIADFVPLRSIVTDVSGEIASGAAQSWIFECNTTHKHCHYEDNPLLPSRILDIGLDQSSSTVKLKVTDKTRKERGPYSALSYCWGGPQPITTTRSSIDTLESGLAIATLPQTIKDAIEVTRWFGFRFLWIDSLCIIQDDIADKQSEIQNMGQIYKHATITIAASASSTVTQGFLYPRAISSCEFQLSLPDGRSGWISVSNFKLISLENHPLNRRGWTFQEHMLSPRLLQFGELELVWTCQTDPIKTITSSDDMRMYQKTQRLPSQIFGIHGRKSWTTRHQRIDLWQQMVTPYSNRKLTYSDDRLNALAGIANELKLLWKDDYFYGSWKDCMIDLLAWHVVGDDKQHQRVSIAPSWSWACIDCPIRFTRLARQSAIFRKTSDLAGSGPGSIFLSCKMLREEDILSSHSLVISKFQDLNNDECQNVDKSQKKQVHYLLLGESKAKRYMRDCGLIVVNFGQRSFKRIGLFEIFGEECKAAWDIAKYQDVTLI